ncbi:uncharacterized protein [Coffea arabica]|uniref:Transmembrane protein n=1 Tax=Coffea arabica TaxID=13443 RepID=A0ABM4UVQ1_COFAR|nr:uncharacterized protein LOC113696355 [Coffea arabica]
MEFLQPIGAAVMVLQESIKLLPKNGKLVALTILPTLLFSSLFFLVFNFSYKSLLRDMLMRESMLPLTSANSAEFSSILAHLKEDFGLMLVVDLTFILGYYIISLLSIIATILVSTISHTERTLSNKDFALLVLRSWKRPLITGFYTTLLDIGYIFLVLFVASPVMMFFSNSMEEVFFTIYLVGIAAYIVYLYLSITWILGIVTSVIEEDCYGIQALGKAGDLIQGMKIQGFVLNMMFALLSVVVFQGFRIIRGHKWLVNQTIFGLFLVNVSCLLRLSQFVGYTVLYFQCKKKHGEEIELQGEVEYTKISSTPLADVGMP